MVAPVRLAYSWYSAVLAAFLAPIVQVTGPASRTPFCRRCVIGYPEPGAAATSQVSAAGEERQKEQMGQTGST